MQVRIYGRTYAMGGLTGVGTYPEYSNLGLMHRLLEQALRDMRRRGQYICYLYPYSIPITGGRAGSWYPIQSPMRSRIISSPRPGRCRGQSGGSKQMALR